MGNEETPQEAAMRQSREMGQDKEPYRLKPPKSPWLQIDYARTPPGIEKQLTRIADCLEAILEQAYGYSMTPPKGDTSGPEPQVMYTDQDKYDIDEMVERVKEEEEG